MLDWKHVLLLGVLVVWYQLRRTAEAMNTKAGEDVKLALLRWLQRK